MIHANHSILRNLVNSPSVDPNDVLLSILVPRNLRGNLSILRRCVNSPFYTGPGTSQRATASGGLIDDWEGFRDLLDESYTSPRQLRAPSRSHATSNTMTLFHQTDRAAAEAIIRQQRFTRGNSGLAGGGIYFAASASETQAKAQKHGTVLVAEVSLGRIKQIHGGDSSISYSSLRNEGYDSVCINGRSSGLEYVVYNYGQISNIREH